MNTVLGSSPDKLVFPRQVELLLKEALGLDRATVVTAHHWLVLLTIMEHLTAHTARVRTRRPDRTTACVTIHKPDSTHRACYNS